MYFLRGFLSESRISRRIKKWQTHLNILIMSSGYVRRASERALMQDTSCRASRKSRLTGSIRFNDMIRLHGRRRGLPAAPVARSGAFDAFRQHGAGSDYRARLLCFWDNPFAAVFGRQENNRPFLFASGRYIHISIFILVVFGLFWGIIYQSTRQEVIIIFGVFLSNSGRF